MTLENILNSEEKALKFINKLGFATLFPVRGTDFPSLYRAAVGNREEKFEKSWIWAENLALKKMIYYGKLVRKQVTLISLEMFPYFYRLCRRNKFSETAQRILCFLKQYGAVSTTDLRKNLNFTGRKGRYEFAKAIKELEFGFAVTTVGIGKPPKWTHTWDIIERWMPQNLLRKAESVSKTEAKEKILAKLLEGKIVSKPEEAKRFVSRFNV